MLERTYLCHSCEALLPPIRARVHCLVCLDYDLCADCHVTASVSGSHHVGHNYEVYRHGGIVLAKSCNKEQEDAFQKTLPQIFAAASSAEHSPEAYWGPILTSAKTLSPIFSRLVAAIFAHFDTTSTGVLQPSGFCALMLAAGFSTMEFPPLTVSTNQSALPNNLHELDAWLANWYRSFPLDHHMATREFPPTPLVQPQDGRIRMRDQFMHAMMYQPPPVVLNGSPMLLQQGLEQYYIYQALHNPTDLSVRLNHLLSALPRLIDARTGLHFETQVIPRPSFPLIPDPEEQERIMMIQRQASQARDAMLQMQVEEEQRALAASHASNMLTQQALNNVSGGWRTDSNGRRYYQQGYFG